MKKFFTFLIFCITCTSIFAKSMQITILSSDSYNITASAILKGALDYAKMAKTRLGADIGIDIHKAKDGEALKEQILNYKADGVSGLILSLTAEATPSDFDSFLAEVSSDEFSISIINPSENFENALVLLKADREKEVELVSDFIKDKTYIFHTKSVYILKDENCEAIEQSKASDLISNIFTKENFDTLCKNTEDNIFVSTPNIATFCKSQNTYISSLENYGLIIANRQLLDDLNFLKENRNRRFVISLETSAMSIAYIEMNLLSATIMQDFFGYGFLSAKALIEKGIEALNPSEKLQKLSPSLYSTENIEELIETCKSWLK